MATENRGLSSTAVIIWSIVAVGVIQTKPVSNAIGGVVVDQAFKDGPIAGQIAGDTIKSVVSGLLGSQTAEPVLEKFAEETNVLLTSPEPQGVKIDISSVKGFVQPMAPVLDKQFDTHLSETPLPSSI